MSLRYLVHYLSSLDLIRNFTTCPLTDGPTRPFWRFASQSFNLTYLLVGDPSRLAGTGFIPQTILHGQVFQRRWRLDPPTLPPKANRIPGSAQLLGDPAVA